MTDLVQSARPASPSFRLALPAWLNGEPRLAALGLLLVALMLPTGLAALIDPRQIAGISVWDKPLKFELALSVYLLTLSFFAHALPQSFLRGRGYRLYATSVIVAILGEVAWLMGAAALGVPSHFNTTPVGTWIYRSMGGLAIWLTAITMVYAVVIARNRTPVLSPALREGLVWGLGLVLPLTLVTAGFMSAFGSHHMGGSASDAGGLWLMGWSRSGGDLRVAHFFATHALHVVPVVAWLGAMAFGPQRLWPARLAAIAYTGFVAYTFVGALLNWPFLAFIG